MAEEGRGEGGHGGADVVDRHLGDVELHEPVDEEGHRPGLDGLGGEGVAVGPGPAHAAEQRAGHDGSGVVADGHDLGALRVSPYGAYFNVAEQPTESHAVPMVSSVRSRA